MHLNGENNCNSSSQIRLSGGLGLGSNRYAAIQTTLNRSMESSQGSSKKQKSVKRAKRDNSSKKSLKSKSNKSTQSKKITTTQKDASDFQKLIISGDAAKFNGSLPV